ncbi:MAG TPA: EVE domain-containing protein [Steroidobacteraceae bacterium]
MTGHFLLKTEPSDYSFADLMREKETVWDGVANPAALRNLRGMSPGDRLVIYETGDVKSAVGLASVVSVDGAQAKEPRVRIKAAKPLPRAIPLSQIKAARLFADSPLVRQGRLSVVPLTGEQYRYMAGGEGKG